MRNLDKLGIKTVLNLRAFHSDSGEIKGTGLEPKHIPMKSRHPEEEDAVIFLKIVTDPDNAPVLVHCQHGADRTGALMAIYRIAVEGWSKEEALSEMTGGSYGFHAVWTNLPPWIENLDIESICREAAIPSSRHKLVRPSTESN